MVSAKKAMRANDVIAPRMGTNGVQRNPVVRLVILGVGHAHHDERDVEQPVDDEVEDAPGVREGVDVGQQDEQEDEPAGDGDRAVRRAEPGVNLVEFLGDDSVAPHGEVDARGGENRGVRGRGRGEEAAEQHRARADRTDEESGDVDDGGLVPGDEAVVHRGQHGQENERVHQRHDDDAAEDGPREVLSGVLDFLRDGGYLDEPEVRDEDEAGHRQERRQAPVRRDERAEFGEVRVQESEEREHGEDGQQDEHDGVL